MWDEAGMVRTCPCIFVTSVDQFQAFVNFVSIIMRFFYVCFELHYVVFQCAGSLHYNCASNFLLCLNYSLNYKRHERLNVCF